MAQPKAEHVGQPKGWLRCDSCYEWRPPQFVGFIDECPDHQTICVDCAWLERRHPILATWAHNHGS